MAKYDPLRDFLAGLPRAQNRATLSFARVEALIGEALPPSARTYDDWWRGRARWRKVIDVESRRPAISNIVGGLSGPAIRPIAVRMVYECRQAVKIPIVGMGGIASARDALEFLIAGATAVQIGTANFVDPFIWTKLLDGVTEYLQRHNIDRVSDLVGSIDTRTRDSEWISS